MSHRISVIVCTEPHAIALNSQPSHRKSQDLLEVEWAPLEGKLGKEEDKAGFVAALGFRVLGF